ncbi:hypothetical protein [Streptomyces griseofuscus]|uniref:Uncharacterized protein n=1 Tax=Streptomyces griseofuscus TaxID=146922 RepID=A0A3R8Q685_9ACTN|nr:hypothetical protein [Streptomyces griseofuscus]RRQ81539.1 hypothetical protein CQW44_30525 [Streptomyces griseofuscus]
MLRKLLIALLVIYLITVGLFPAALAPINLAFAGLAAVLGAVPGSAWLLAGGIAWLRHRRVAVVSGEVV